VRIGRNANLKIDLNDNAEKSTRTDQAQTGQEDTTPYNNNPEGQPDTTNNKTYSHPHLH
jgi:hypothetical protein